MDSPTPTPDVSADTPAESATDPHPLPKPGRRFEGRVVRASGHLPFSGNAFVLTRHKGRHQLRAIRSAQAEAAAEGRDPSAADQMIHLAARVTYLADGPGGDLVAVDDVDGILDLDGEDLDFLLGELNGGAGAKDADAPPPPPSPSS